MIPTLVGITIMVFAISRLAPGDPAGVWLCAGIEGISNDNGLSYVITYSFHHRSDYWEQTVIYIDPNIGRPPKDLAFGTSEGDIGLGDFEINFTVTPVGADESLWIQAAVTNSPAITYVSNLLRFVGISAAAQASPLDNQVIIEARFGALIVGQTVHQWVSVLDRLSGQLSPPRRTSVVVVTT